MQAAVHVAARGGDEILDAAGHRPPSRVDDAERGVAVLHGAGDDAQGEEVIDLVDVNALALELLVDAVEPLDPPLDAGGNVVIGEHGAHLAVHAMEELLAPGAAAV